MVRLNGKSFLRGTVARCVSYPPYALFEQFPRDHCAKFLQMRAVMGQGLFDGVRENPEVAYPGPVAFGDVPKIPLAILHSAHEESPAIDLYRVHRVSFSTAVISPCATLPLHG